jgi:hypothetical protein
MLRGHTGRLMNAQTGFRAECREQAGLAMAAFGHFWSRYAPGGRNRILLRAGCLIFAPLATLTVWLLQAVVWLMVGTPVLAYALLMAAIGGGFSRDHRRPQPFSRIAPNPPPPT